MTWHSAVLAAVMLATTAQAPATPDPVPWCTRIPLPRADIGSLKSDVDSRAIHVAQPAECRVLDVRGPRATLHLAVASTASLREHGLMGVPYVPYGEGMLFAFDDGDRRRSFWMKNTIAPLDMIFVKSDGTISTIAANVPATTPGTPDADVATREGVGRYVIELAAGDAARFGLAAGTRLRVPEVVAR